MSEPPLTLMFRYAATAERIFAQSTELIRGDIVYWHVRGSFSVKIVSVFSRQTISEAFMSSVLTNTASLTVLVHLHVTTACCITEMQMLSVNVLSLRRKALRNGMNTMATEILRDTYTMSCMMRSQA